MAQGSTTESVRVKGVLLRGPPVFVRVGLFGLALQRAIGSPLLAFCFLHAPFLCRRRSQCTCQALPRRSGGYLTSPLRGAGWNLQLRPLGLRCSGLLGLSYLTRFWVHSRSLFVSRAVLSPSLKLARTPFRRRWARACSSSSSCCFALRWPELFQVQLC